MAPKLEKRKIIWTLSNFTREAQENYNEPDDGGPATCHDHVESENFKICCNGNETEW
jgi:hypothetical protein